MKTFVRRLYSIGILVIILSLLSSSLAEDKQKSFDVNKGDKLDLSTRMGNIIVDTWDKSEVNVLVRNIISSELDLLKMSKDGNTVRVAFKGEDSDDIEFEIKIPSNLNLELATGGGNISLNGDLNGKIDASTGGGNISTKNIDGGAEISTGGGNIKTGNINGSANISTGGGDLNIGDVNGVADISTAGGNIRVGNIGGQADISTAGGNINVGNVGGKAEISTAGGNIYVEDIGANTQGGSAEVSTAGGNIVVKNVSGSAEINSAGGNLSLSGATGRVEANTAGGNIKLENIKGFIEANTAGGNIYAELYPDGKNSSELNTAGGDIKLLIPSDSKVTIIATYRVRVWDSDEESEHIKSDFTETSRKRNRERKEIKVTYVVNGGGSQIELNTAMGDIEIRKLK